MAKAEGCGGHKLVRGDGFKFDREVGVRDNRRSSNLKIPGADA